MPGVWEYDGVWVMQYSDFIASKRILDIPSGFGVPQGDLNPMLFDFQKYLTQWALKRGKAAIFADCGLGKTPVQLEWASHVCRHTGRDVLIVAPLAVSKQTRREGEKFGHTVHICRTQSDVKPGINICNYEMLQHFEASAFGGIVLDESSILKGLYGKFRKSVTDFAAQIPFRLACTATPAPNDIDEIVNHAEFLGIMSIKEVLALFFTQDFTATAHKWKFKGHARKDFWMWLASWARALRMPEDLGFDNNGFILPPLNIEQHVVESNPFERGMLFSVEAVGLNEQRESRRATLDERVKVVADLVNRSNEQWIVWCDLNIESEGARKTIHGAVEVKGSDSSDHKEVAMMGFAAGEIKCLVTKPSICGWGMNFQSCHNIAFLGISNSFEMWYQAVRRCWRYGQKQPVNVHVVISDMDGNVVRNLKRKEREASELFTQIIANMRDFQMMQAKREEAEYETEEQSGLNWTLYLGDSVETIDRIESESVGLIVFSPPFPGMYVYSNSPRDMGNVKDMAEMIEHFRFLAGKMLRVLMPGRICAIHLTQGLAFKHSDGYVGLKDFRGSVIKVMEDEGWIYYGEVLIDKDPQLKALRTRDHGLLFKTLTTDAAKCRMAIADYILQFRKPGNNPEAIRAGTGDHLKQKNAHGWITNAEWVEWAAPVWYRKSEAYPGGIQESDVLNYRSGREEDDEKHLCPLQIGVIERCVKLWSNPGDLVYSPFAGIGSEGVVAIKYGRRFIGGELKRSYFDVAVKNLSDAEVRIDQPGLFEATREALIS